MGDVILQAKGLVTPAKYINLSIALMKVAKYNDAAIYINKSLETNPNGNSTKFAKAFDSPRSP